MTKKKKKTSLGTQTRKSFSNPADPSIYQPGSAFIFSDSRVRFLILSSNLLAAIF